ncbi:hypothetical protein [Roseivirga thermotolerans]|uniref:hypothetical protein n=1 Tax=Roseivirga thermotolerans TaxID=1758176 RepID=UPI00273F4085|nr:hypothetical protein [Roseivirga thermotolerans]
MKNLTVTLNLFQGLFKKDSAPEKSEPNGEHNFGHHWCHHQCEKSGEDTACGEE